MLATQRDVDQIAEYADSSIRATVPMAPAMRHGSLPGIKARRGLNEWLYRKWGNTGNAAYTFIGSLLTIALSGGVAWALDEPLLFPSLGATAFLMFETPMAEVSSPRNAVIGHLVGGAVAFFWLWVFGLIDEPSAIQEGFSEERAAAVALSVAFTGGILRLLRAAHPPAGATTVIVSVGLLDTGHEMAILAAGVLLVVIPAGIINRLLGVPAPLWVSPWSGFSAGFRRRKAEKAEKGPQGTPAASLLFGPPLFGTLPGTEGPSPGQGLAADWYPDPIGQARVRYWDGSRWTDKTAQ
jgi:CBS domain-containing membrane protein